MKILLLGMNHKSAPLDVRERFAIDDPTPMLQKLVACDEIDEAVVVSTCNRVELVVTTHQPEAARLRLMRALAEPIRAGGGDGLLAGRALDDFVYEYADGDAIRHVFRVASSIDSMVVGEPQILGQLKDAYRVAVEAGACGAVLSRLFQRAFSTAKRVVNETRIAERPVSVARVAVDLAAQIFEDLAGKSALLVGAGEMIERALVALQGEGLSQVRVANRTRAHADELARRFSASAHGLDELEELLAQADVVLTCIGGSEPLIDVARVRRALEQRRRRPLFLIDIGVPRNVEPAVNELEAAFLYDIDDLQDVASANVDERRRETIRAEDIVQEEEQHFAGWLAALHAVPTIRHLRARAESIRTAELERALGRLELGEDGRDRVDALTRAIVNKILHAPLARLRDGTDREEGLAMLEAARRLFALDDDAERGPQDAEPDPESGEEE